MRNDATWTNYYSRKTLCSLDKLSQLGCRTTGDFTLSSGLKSSIKWEIETLFEFPAHMVKEALSPLIWEIGIKGPYYLIGIPTGGYMLARVIGAVLDIPPHRILEASKASWNTAPVVRTILIDDVLTTGNAIRHYLKKLNDIIAVAVLVNRSGGLTKVRNIPIISGIFVDTVEGAKEIALND